jgi:cytochrome P450
MAGDRTVTAQQTFRKLEEVYDPHSQAYCDNPVPSLMDLEARGPLVWFEPWQTWIMTQMPDIMKCWKEEYLLSNFQDWNLAPPIPPKESWDNFEQAMIGHSMLNSPEHHRMIRRIVSPAFSRNVVDEIQRRIEPEVAKLFDKLGKPEYFDYRAEIAQHIPFISITKMVGVPEKYWDTIRPLIMNFTEGTNPTIPDERRKRARALSNQAIDILKLVIEERRHSPQQDDFLSTLLKIEAENENFVEGDVISLILSLIGAGADTTLVGQQWTVYSLLKHKEQIPTALATPDSFANAFNEVFRWGIISKMGFARYVPQDGELLGQQVKKGQMVLMMPHLINYKPEYFPDPERFDVTREFKPDILFGYGPRFCIGAALAKRQLYLTMQELVKRFPNIELAEEPERSNADHNAIVFKKLMLKTNC